MALPAIGAMLTSLKAVGTKVAAKVGVGTAAKGLAASGAKAAAAGGAAAGGAAAGGAAATAGKAASTFGKVMAAKEVLWDLPASAHVLSDVARGTENAREYTRTLGGRATQAAQQLPKALPPGRKVPRGLPQDVSGLWQSPAPSQRVLPAAAAAPPRIPKIGGTPPTAPGGQGGARPQGFFNKVGDRFNQWRQSRAAQAATPRQLKTPSTRIPKGADFQKALQNATRKLTDRDPIPRGAPSLPWAGDETSRQEQQERKAEAAEHGQGGMKKTAVSVALLGVALPVALHKSIQGVEQWTSGLMESYRPMERLNAAFATTFAKLERQNLVLTGRTARATSGTAGMLGKELIALRQEMQPMREATTQLRNMVQIGLIHYARMANALLMKMADKVGLLEYLKSIDQALQDEAMPTQNAWIRMFDEIGRGTWGPRRRP